MSMNGSKIVGIKTIMTRLATADRGWANMEVIVLEPFFGAARGATFLRACVPRAASGTSATYRVYDVGFRVARTLPD